MVFLDEKILYLLLLLPIYFVRYKLDKKNIYLLISFIFMILALSRPAIISNNLKNSQHIEFVVALDISKSMLAQDLKPNRFEFAKEKIKELLSNLNGEKVVLLAFSNQSYMLSPSNNNYEIINFLIKNLEIENVNKNGTNFLSVFKNTNELLKHKTKKVILIFSDGGESEDFEDEIAFAKKNKISCFVYGIGTLQGSVIKEKDGLIKDEDGNIVISKLNENIEKLASKTDGKYQEFSLKDDDLKNFINLIRENFDSDLKSQFDENKMELFYFPLIFSIIFFILGRFNLKGIL